MPYALCLNSFVSFELKNNALRTGTCFAKGVFLFFCPLLQAWPQACGQQGGPWPGSPAGNGRGWWCRGPDSPQPEEGWAAPSPSSRRLGGGRFCGSVATPRSTVDVARVQLCPGSACGGPTPSGRDICRVRAWDLQDWVQSRGGFAAAVGCARRAAAGKGCQAWAIATAPVSPVPVFQRDAEPFGSGRCSRRSPRSRALRGVGQSISGAAPVLPSPLPRSSAVAFEGMLGPTFPSGASLLRGCGPHSHRLCCSVSDSLRRRTGVNHCSSAAAPKCHASRGSLPRHFVPPCFSLAVATASATGEPRATGREGDAHGRA